MLRQKISSCDCGVAARFVPEKLVPENTSTDKWSPEIVSGDHLSVALLSGNIFPGTNLYGRLAPLQMTTHLPSLRTSHRYICCTCSSYSTRINIEVRR